MTIPLIYPCILNNHAPSPPSSSLTSHCHFGSSGIILEIDVKLIKLIKPPHVLWGSMSDWLWGRAKLKPTHLAANHCFVFSPCTLHCLLKLVTFWIQVSIHITVTLQSANLLSSLSTPLSVSLFYCCSNSKWQPPLCLLCRIFEHWTVIWTTDRRKQEGRKPCMKISALDMDKHPKQSCPPVGIHLLFTMLQRKLKGGICDSSALSVFPFSDNEGQKKFKAQKCMGLCVKGRPAAELEWRVTCICIG